MSWQTLAAACAVVVKEDEMLLIRARRNVGVFWELPGGYVDPGETFEQAAAREALEETGVAVEIGSIVCTLIWSSEGRRRRNIVAYFAATPVDPSVEPRPQVEEGIEAARYVAVRGLDPETIHPMERPIFARWPEVGYHLHADVVENADGVPVYNFR